MKDRSILPSIVCFLALLFLPHQPLRFPRNSLCQTESDHSASCAWLSLKSKPLKHPMYSAVDGDLYGRKFGSRPSMRAAPNQDLVHDKTALIVYVLSRRSSQMAGEFLISKYQAHKKIAVAGCTQWYFRNTFYYKYPIPSRPAPSCLGSRDLNAPVRLTQTACWMISEQRPVLISRVKGGRSAKEVIVKWRKRFSWDPS